MESVIADDNNSVIDALRNDIIQGISTAYSSIIEKYICLSHGLEPPDIDIEQFYGNNRVQKECLLKLLKQERHDSSPSSCHIITSKNYGNHTPGNTSVEFSEQVQETLRKRKIELGLPEDTDLYEVLESDCDTRFLEPSNEPKNKARDEKMYEKKNYRQTGKIKDCRGKKDCDGRVPGKMKIKQIVQTGIASCELKGNGSKHKAESASQEKETQKPLQDEQVSKVMGKIDLERSCKKRRKERKLRNVQKNSSQDMKKFNSEVNIRIGNKMKKKNLTVKQKQLDPMQMKFECDGPQPRIMKDKKSDELKIQKDIPDIIENVRDEVNTLDNKVDSVSQNKIKKSPQVKYKTREMKMKLRNKEVDVSHDEKKSTSQNKKEICSKNVQVNTRRGMSKTHVKKYTGHKNNSNKRKLSEKDTKSHLMNDHSKAFKELVDVRSGNCTVVLTEVGDTIFIPPLTQHEKDNFISSIRKVYGKNYAPVFFATFNVQDKEVSQPVRSPLNAATVSETMILESSQRKSKVEVTPHKKSSSCNGDKNMRKNIIMEEKNKNYLNKNINCRSPFNASTVEPATTDSYQKVSRTIMLPNEEIYFSEDYKSKRKNTQVQKTKNSQNEFDFEGFSQKCRKRCSQPEKPHFLPSKEVKESMDTRRIGLEKNVSVDQDSTQSLSVQKPSRVRKELENDTSSSKTILCCQPKEVSCSEKENTFFNKRTPQSKSSSQNTSLVGLKEKKIRNEKTFTTSYKKAKDAVDHERSEMIQISPSAAVHSIFNGENFPRNSLSGESESEISHTFSKETLSQSTKKRSMTIKRGLSVSKGRIVLEFLDRNAQKNKMFKILEEDTSYDNEKNLSGKVAKDDKEKHVETGSLSVPNVKSTVSSNVGEICEKNCSIPNILDKDMELNKEWHIREEESIIAGIDAVKKKRKKISSCHPLVTGHSKDFIKSGQLGDQNSSIRSILPEVSSIGEDITIPLVSSTKLEMPNDLVVPGIKKSNILKPQNEYNRRRKVDVILCPVAAKKPKLDKSQQLLKNCSPERKYPACGKPNLVVSTNISNSVNSTKQTDPGMSKVKFNFGKYLFDSSRKKILPSYQENYSDIDEELSLLPVESSLSVVGPPCSSSSKLKSTLYDHQFQNLESERVKTGLHTMNSTVNTNFNNTSKVHKKSQSFWELDDDEEEMKTYMTFTQSLLQDHKHGTYVKRKNVSYAQTSISNLSAVTDSTPSYRVLGGERWLAAITSMKKHKKPFLMHSSLSSIKKKMTRQRSNIS